MMMGPDLLRTAEAVRRFNRFYARHCGALHERLHKSDFSLTEVRVFHELIHDRARTAADVARNLGLDTGYLSRLLSSFERRGFMTRRPNQSDARQHLLSLTPMGHAIIETIDSGGLHEVSAALGELAPPERAQLVTSMADIERLLSSRGERKPLHLRRPQRGDFGWMVERHAQFDDAGAPRNEARAAGVVARYLGAMESDARRIACWIAEHNDGARIGAALLSAGSESEARIELLFVEPGARRLGLGAQLVAACTGFASEAGYESVSCAFDESHTDLSALFARAGFRPYGGAAPGVVWQRPLQSLYA